MTLDDIAQIRIGKNLVGIIRMKQILAEVVSEIGIEAVVEKVTDAMKIAGYGVFGTPAMVIDGEVKSVGKIPTKEDIKSWLT